MSNQHPLSVEFLAPPTLVDGDIYTIRGETTDPQAIEMSNNTVYGISSLAMREVDVVENETPIDNSEAMDEFREMFGRLMNTFPDRINELISGNTLTTSQTREAARLMGNRLHERSTDFTGLATYDTFRGRIFNAFRRLGEAPNDTQVLNTGIKPKNVRILSGITYQETAEDPIPSIDTLKEHDRRMRRKNNASVLDKQGVLKDNSVGAAAIFVDLRGFKSFNDRHNHSVGDEALKVVGTKLSRFLRALDERHPQDYFLTHRSGDEFIISLFGVDEVGAQAVTTRIAQALEDIRVYPVPGEPAESLTGCLAGAFAPEVSSYEEAMYLIQAADDALNEQKKAERTDRQDSRSR